MESDALGQVVPAVAGVEQAIVVLVLGAREEHHKSTTDDLLDLADEFRDAQEPVQRRGSEERYDRLFVRTLQLCDKAVGNTPPELALELHPQKRRLVEVLVAILIAGHPLGEPRSAIHQLPPVIRSVGGLLEFPDAGAKGSLEFLLVHHDHDSLSLIHISEPTRRTPISYAV